MAVRSQGKRIRKGKRAERRKRRRVLGMKRWGGMREGGGRHSRRRNVTEREGVFRIFYFLLNRFKITQSNILLSIFY